MSTDQNSSSDNVQVRRNMVETAVNFLLNPSVVDKPYGHKIAFLKKKGLTDAEISMAYEKVQNDPSYLEFQRKTSQNPLIVPPPVPAYDRPVSFLSRLNAASSSFVVLGVAIFGAHYIYKNYIEPLIFGKSSTEDEAKKFEKHLQETLDLLTQLERKLSSLEERVESQSLQMDRFFHTEINEFVPTPLALKELKVEIGSVKSLLLNRHSFPALPKVSAPSIPAWQLPQEEKEQQNEDEHKDPSLSENKTPSEDSFETLENNVKDGIASGSETEITESDLPPT